MTILTIFLFVSACSSLPKNYAPPSAVKREGITLYKRATALSQMNKRNMALRYFSDARAKFYLSDDMEYIIKTNISIARELFYLNKMETSDSLMAVTLENINFWKPKLLSEYQLAKIEFFFNQAHYDSVLVYSDHVKKASEENQVFIQCYKVLSLFKTSNLKASDINDLESKLEGMEKLRKKNELQDINSLSFAYYTMAFVAYDLKRLNDARSWIEKARNLDQGYENYLALASDLYLLGCIFEQQKAYSEAKSVFYRCADVYRELMDKENQKCAVAKALINDYQLSKNHIVLGQLLEIQNQLSDPKLIKDIEEIVKQ